MSLLQLMQQAQSLNKPYYSSKMPNNSLELLSWTVEVARHNIGAEALSKADTDTPGA